MAPRWQRDSGRGEGGEMISQYIADFLIFCCHLIISAVLGSVDDRLVYI